MAIQNKIKYQNAKPGDFDEIYNFHLDYFGNIRSEYVWQWQYGKLNPNKSLLLIGLAENKIVATQGAFAIDLIVDGEKICSGKNESLLLDKNYRQKGIFTQFYNYAFTEYSAAQINVLWGFTKAIGPFKYVGFSFDRIINRSVLSLSYTKSVQIGKINRLPFIKSLIYRLGALIILLFSFLLRHFMVLLIKRQANIKISDSLKNGNDLVTFFTKIRKKYHGLIHINMDHAFLDWRIYKSPNKIDCFYAYADNDLTGYLILEKTKDFTEILDFCFLTKESSQQLIKKLNNHLINNDIKFITYSGNKLNPLNKIAFQFLKRYGFIRIKAPNGFVLKILNSSHELSLKNLQNWYITSLWNEGN